MISLIQALDETPPIMCRCFARKRNGRVLMTYSDIARVSGLGRRTVIRISKKTSWRGMTVDAIQKFSMACGLNLGGGKTAQGEFVKSGLKLKSIHANSHRNQRRMLDRIRR